MRSEERQFKILRRFAALWWGAGALMLTACASPAFAPVNLQAPGWTVRQGQAVWRRPNGGAGIAGDILAATRAGGFGFVQFSKGSLPMVEGQLRPGAWTAKFPLAGEQHSGRGRPPGRIIFLQLLGELEGRPPGGNWSWQTNGDGGWRLANHSSDESLDVYWQE